MPCALAVAFVVAATAVQAAPTARFGRLSVEDGLSQSTVQAILQDGVGFLWFGTEEGLNRYDGYGVTVFKHDPTRPTSLPHDRVAALVEDDRHQLWVGTDRGLARFDRAAETFTLVGGVTQRITGLAADGGIVWAGVEGYGVFAVDAATGAVTRYVHDDHDPLSFGAWVPSALLRDGGGRLWAGTRTNGLDVAEPGPGPRRFRHLRHDARDPRSLAHDEIWGLAESPDGTIWVATYGGGVDAIDEKTGAVRHFRHDPDNPNTLGSDLATSVFVDRAGTVWVGTDGAGLQKFDRTTATFRGFHHDPRDSASLSQDVIRTLGEDGQGQLWVGTFLGGVNVLRSARRSFGYFTHDPSDPWSLASPNVTTFTEDDKGRVWAGTTGGWLHLFDRETGTFVRYELPPALPGALSLLADRKGRLWIGSYRGGLGQFEPTRGVTAVSRHRPGDATSLGNDEIWALAESPSGALWVGTNDGVDLFDADRRVVTRHFDTPSAEGPGNSGVRALLYDREGTLWIGTFTALYRLRPDAAALERFRPDDAGFAHDGVVALHEDRAGRLWAGTLGGGLKRIDPAGGAPAVYKAFPSNTIYGVEEQADGRLWLSTNHGLVRFAPDSGRFETYDLSNGLESLQFNLAAAYALRDGEILFGSVDGLYDFKPEAIVPDAFVPPVVLTSFRVFGEPLPLPGALPTLRQVTLAHSDQVFSLEFAALDYSLPRHNQYQYQLEGFNERWLTIGQRREATFTNLDPGTYTFRVKASNADGRWSAASTALQIVVTPPLWGTAWFRATALALVFSVLLALHRYRIRRLTDALIERRRSELALRRSDEEVRRTVSVLQSTLESTADGIVVIDKAGRVVSFNQRFAQLWSIPPEALSSRDSQGLLAHFAGQVLHPEPFVERVRLLDAQPEAESFDLLELADGRVFERYSLPQRLDGAAVGRVWSFRDITERRRAEQTVEYQAYHDALTGLPNRLLLEDRLAQALVHAQRHRRTLAVIFMDVDHFKLINDTLGHAVGDRLLKGVAERLRGTIRVEDTVARLGGDEFTLLFDELSRAEDAARMAEKLLDAFASPFSVDGHELYVTASIGVALYPNDGGDAEALLRNADAAMYRSKEAGRNTYQLFTPGMNARALERMSVERELRRALDRGELVLHYQPLVALADARPVGVEALVRWNHPERGLIFPDAFIPVAEESRLIVPMGEWVLNEACRQLSAWRAAGLDGLRMAVNLSARQLQQPNLAKFVDGALSLNGVPAALLELEITESAAMQNVESTKSVLHALRAMGVRISIDDFGTGQSSLSYLKNFPLSTLKIDRTFVRDIALDSDDEAIVRAIVALAHVLKLDVVAEGVETDAQLAFLREAGCEEGQGYLFSRPLPAPEAQLLLGRGRARVPR